MSSNARRRIVGRGGGARYRRYALALPLLSSDVDRAISVEVGQVVRRHLLDITVDTMDRDFDTNENSNNAFHNDSGSESNDDAEAGANNGASNESEDDVKHLSGGTEVLGENGTGTEDSDSTESSKESERSLRASILMNVTEAPELVRNGGSSSEDLEPIRNGEQGAPDNCALSRSRDTNENYDDERNDRQFNQQGRGRGVGRRGLAHRPAVLDYGLPDDNIGMLDEDFDFILTVDPNTAVVANPLEPIGNQPGGSNVQGQHNPVAVVAVDEAHQSTALATPETPVQVVHTDDLQSVARNYNNPTVPAVADNLVDLILDSTASDVDNETNRQDLPERGSQIIMSDVLCSEYACTLESNMLEIPSSNEDDTTAESILTASSSLRREIKISLPMLNVDLSPANIISKGIEEISPNLIADLDIYSPMDGTPEDNSNSHPNSSASNEDELKDEQDLASAENDFRSLDFALIKESLAVEKERTEQDADALLDQVIGGFKDKGMGPNNADINTYTASENDPISINGNGSEEKPSANHDTPFEDCNYQDKTGEDVSIVSLNSSPDVYELNSLECDSQSNAKVSNLDNYLAKSTIPLTKDSIIEKSLHDDVGEPYVNNSLCIDERGVDSCMLLATENKAPHVDDRDTSCIQPLSTAPRITRATSDVHSDNDCTRSPIETTENMHVKTEASNCVEDESDKGKSVDDRDCHSLQVAQAMEALLSAAVAASNENNLLAALPKNGTDGTNSFQSSGGMDPTDSSSLAQLHMPAAIDTVFSYGNTARFETVEVTNTEHHEILTINNASEDNADNKQCLQEDVDGADEGIHLTNYLENINVVPCSSTTGIDETCKLSTSHSNEEIQCIGALDETIGEMPVAEEARQSKSSNSFVNSDGQVDTSVSDPRIETEYLRYNMCDDVVEINKNDDPDVNRVNENFFVAAEINKGIVKVQDVDSLLAKDVVEVQDVNSMLAKDFVAVKAVDSMLAKDVVEVQDVDSLKKDSECEDIPSIVNILEDTALTKHANIDIDVKQSNEDIEPHHVNETLNVSNSVAEINVAKTDDVSAAGQYNSSLGEDITNDTCGQSKNVQDCRHYCEVQLDMQNVAYTNTEDPCNGPHNSHDSMKAVDSLPSPKEDFLKEVPETLARSSGGTQGNLHDTPGAEYSVTGDSGVNTLELTSYHEDKYISTGAADVTESRYNNAGINGCDCAAKKQTQYADVIPIGGSPIDGQVCENVSFELHAENQQPTTADVQNEATQHLHILAGNGEDQQGAMSICEDSNDVNDDNQEQTSILVNVSPILAHEKQFEDCLEDADRDLEPPSATRDSEIRTSEEPQDMTQDTDVHHSEAKSPLFFTDRYEQFCCQEKTLYHNDNIEADFSQVNACVNDREGPQVQYATLDDQKISLDTNASVPVVNDLGESSSCIVSSCNIHAVEMSERDQGRGTEGFGEHCPKSGMCPSDLDSQTFCGNDVRSAENIQGSHHAPVELDETCVETDKRSEVDEGQSACLEVRDSVLTRMDDAGRLGDVEIGDCRVTCMTDYDGRLSKSELEDNCADDILKTESATCLQIDLLKMLPEDVGAINVESNCQVKTTFPEPGHEECVFDRDNIDGSRPGVCTPGLDIHDAEGENNDTVAFVQSTPAFEPEELMEKLLHLEVTLEESAAVSNSSTAKQIAGCFVSTDVHEKPEDLVASAQQEDGGHAGHLNGKAIEEVGMIEFCAELMEAQNSSNAASNTEDAFQKQDQFKSSIRVNESNLDEMPVKGRDFKLSAEARFSDSINIMDVHVKAKKEHLFDIDKNMVELGSIASDNEGTPNTSKQSEKIFVCDEVLGQTLCDFEVRRERSSENTGVDQSLVEQVSKDSNPNRHTVVDKPEVNCTAIVAEHEANSEDEDLIDEPKMFGKSGSNISVQPTPGCDVCKEKSSSSLAVACARRLSHSSIGSRRSGCLENGASAERIIQNPNDDMFPVAKVILDATDLWLNRISDFCQSSEMLSENPSKLQEIAHECTSQLVSLTQSSEFCQEHAHNVALLSRSGTKTQSASSVHSENVKNMPLTPLSGSSSTTVSVKSQPRCNSSNASLLKQANLCRCRISTNSETRLDLQNRVSVPSVVASTSRVKEKRDTDSLSSHSSSCSSMLSEKMGSKTSLVVLGGKQRAAAPYEESGKDFKLKAERNLNGFISQLYPRPRSTGSSANDHANKPHLPRPNSSRTATHGKGPLKDDIAANQPAKKQQPSAKESEATEELDVDEKADRKSSLTPCTALENNKQGVLLEKRRQPHPPSVDQQDGQANIFKRVMGHLDHGAQFARGRMSRSSPKPKPEESTDSANKDSAKLNRPTPCLGIARRPLLRCVPATQQQSSESGRQTPVGHPEHKHPNNFTHTEKAPTPRSCHPLTFKFKGLKVPFKVDERAECRSDHEQGTGDYSALGKDLARDAHKTEHGQAAGERRDSEKKDQEPQDFKITQLNRQRMGPLKLREHISKKGKSAKMLTMQEFERIQADRHLNQAFARIQSSKPCVDCHMDAKVMDKTGASVKRRRERINYDNLIALENIKFLEMLRFKKSAYDRDEQLKEFKGLKGVEGKNAKLKQIKAAALV